MKVKIIISVLLAMGFSPSLHALDLLHCKEKEEGRVSQLRVYETSTGYGYEIKGCKPNQVCTSHSGPIDRLMTPLRPAMVFKSDGVSILHLFGEYNYFGPMTDATTQYFDEGCILNPGNDFVSNGEAMVIDQPCDSDELFAEAKRQAIEKAEQKCGSPVFGVGQVQKELRCSTEHFPFVRARQIFRCLK